MVDLRQDQHVLVGHQRVVLMDSVLPVIQSLHKKLNQQVVIHCKRVGYYALLMGKYMHLDKQLMEQLYLAALIHDIGKLGIRDEVLLKRGALDTEEYKEIRHHAIIGYEIMKPIKPLHHLLPIVRYHHERMDGGGYPDGLEGEEIPFLARILAIIDAFDAMTDDRNYRSHLSVKEAVHELNRGRGTQFDQELVSCFLHGVIPLVSRDGIRLNAIPDFESHLQQIIQTI